MRHRFCGVIAWSDRGYSQGRRNDKRESEPVRFHKRLRPAVRSPAYRLPLALFFSYEDLGCARSVLTKMLHNASYVSIVRSTLTIDHTDHRTLPRPLPFLSLPIRLPVAAPW
jgi:hypothetical protein